MDGLVQNRWLPIMGAILESSRVMGGRVPFRPFCREGSQPGTPRRAMLRIIAISYYFAAIFFIYQYLHYTCLYLLSTYIISAICSNIVYCIYECVLIFSITLSSGGLMGEPLPFNLKKKKIIVKKPACRRRL